MQNCVIKIHSFVIIKKGEIVRTRFGSAWISLDFDDNKYFNMNEQFWYSNVCCWVLRQIMFWLWIKSHSVYLKQLAQRHCLEALRPEVLMNGLNLWRRWLLSCSEDSEDWRLWMSVLWVEDLKIWRPSVQGSEDRSSDERLQIPELEVQKIMGKWNVVSEDSEPSIILSEVNKKVHCADNIVQQTCKSWQDVTFKLQKALCRWEHAKSTFYLTTVTFSRLSI